MEDAITIEELQETGEYQGIAGIELPIGIDPAQEIDLNLIGVLTDALRALADEMIAIVMDLLPTALPIVGIVLSAWISLNVFEYITNKKMRNDEEWAYNEAGGKYFDEVSYMDSDNARDYDDDFDFSRREQLVQEYGDRGHPDADWLDDDETVPTDDDGFDKY